MAAWWWILLSVVVSRSVLGGPIQLIRPGKNHEYLETVPESLAKLRNIRPPVAVISAVGAVHSGKSFLLNRLWDAKSNAMGFSVGYTVKPETSGLWMWEGQERRGGTAILYLDTEGFFSPNVTETYDAKLFAISTLLSSEVIYNTVKFIDNHHLELLELLIRRTNLFGLRAYARHNRAVAANNATTDMAPISNLASFLRVLLPNQLSWVVQDFVQDLRGVSPEEWLQSLIDLTMTKTGDSVGGFFTHIDCVPLPVPATDPDTLGKLDLVDPRELNPAYTKAVDIFRERLVERAIQRPKFKGGTLTSRTQEPLMSGSDLADLVQFLVAAANGGEEGTIASSEGEPFPQVPSINQQFSSLQLRLMKSDIIAIAERDLTHAVEKAYNSKKPLARFPFEKERAAAEKQARILWDTSVRGLVRSDGLADEVKKASQEFDEGLMEAFARAGAQNCELIDAWCSDNAAKLRSDHQELANKLVLTPKNPNELATELKENMDRLMKIWSSLLAADEGGWEIGGGNCCKGLDEGEVRSSLREILDQARAANDKLIVEALDKMVRDVLQSVQYSLNDAAGQQLFTNTPEKNIAAFFADLKQRSFASFDDVTRPYRALSVCGAKRKELEKALNKHHQDVMTEWTRKCTDVAEEFLKTSSIRFPYSLRRSVSLPADEPVIMAVIEKQSAELRQQFEKTVFCHASQPGKAFVRRLEQQVRDATEALVNQNVNAIKEISGRPLSELKAELMKEAKGYYVAPWFRAEAHHRTLEALKRALTDYDTGGGDKDDQTLSMSQALLERVATQFVEQDLHQANLNIMFGAGILIGLIGVLALAVIGVFRALDIGDWSRASMHCAVAVFAFLGLVMESPKAFLRETLSNGPLLGIVMTGVLVVVGFLFVRGYVSGRRCDPHLVNPIPNVMHMAPPPVSATPVGQGRFSTTPGKGRRSYQPATLDSTRVSARRGHGSSSQAPSVLNTSQPSTKHRPSQPTTASGAEPVYVPFQQTNFSYSG